MRMEISYGLFSELLDSNKFSPPAKHALFDWYEEFQETYQNYPPTPRTLEVCWTEYMEREFVNKYGRGLDDSGEWQELIKNAASVTEKAEFMLNKPLRAYIHAIKFVTPYGNRYLVMDW